MLSFLRFPRRRRRNPGASIPGLGGPGWVQAADGNQVATVPIVAGPGPRALVNQSSRATGAPITAVQAPLSSLRAGPMLVASRHPITGQEIVMEGMAVRTNAGWRWYAAGWQGGYLARGPDQGPPSL